MSSINTTAPRITFKYMAVFKLCRLKKPVEGIKFTLRVEVHRDSYVEDPIDNLDHGNEYLAALMSIICYADKKVCSKIICINPKSLFAVYKNGMEGNLSTSLTEQELDDSFDNYNERKFREYNITNWEEVRTRFNEPEDMYTEFLARMTESVASDFGKCYNAKIEIVNQNKNK